MGKQVARRGRANQQRVLRFAPFGFAQGRQDDNPRNRDDRREKVRGAGKMPYNGAARIAQRRWAVLIAEQQFNIVNTAERTETPC